MERADDKMKAERTPSWSQVMLPTDEVLDETSFVSRVSKSVC